jgi:hypothetical protein
MNPEVKDQSQYPAVFSFSYGSFADYREVRWENDGLVYRQDLRAEVITLSPTVADWRRFWALSEAVNLWEWREYYMNDEILDGTQWELEVEFQGQKVVSGGSNAFPGWEKGPFFPDGCEFGRFLHAVRTLTGGKFQ